MIIKILQFAVVCIVGMWVGLLITLYGLAPQQACVDAVNAADVVFESDLDLIDKIVDAYLDYPEEDLGEFGLRVEGILGATDAVSFEKQWTEYSRLAEECLEE